MPSELENKNYIDEFNDDVPKIAVIIDTGIWQKIFSSSLSNSLSF